MAHYPHRSCQGARPDVAEGNGGAYADNTRVHVLNVSADHLFPDGASRSETITLEEYRRMTEDVNG